VTSRVTTFIVVLIFYASSKTSLLHNPVVVRCRDISVGWVYVAAGWTRSGNLRCQ